MVLEITNLCVSLQSLGGGLSQGLLKHCGRIPRTPEREYSPTRLHSTSCGPSHIPRIRCKPEGTWWLHHQNIRALTIASDDCFTRLGPRSPLASYGLLKHCHTRMPAICVLNYSPKPDRKISCREQICRGHAHKLQQSF